MKKILLAAICMGLFIVTGCSPFYYAPNNSESHPLITNSLPQGALDVPYYQNDKKRCGQTAMRMVIKYYLNEDYTLDELDELVGRTGHYRFQHGTHQAQSAVALYKLGLNVRYFSKKSPESLIGKFSEDSYNGRVSAYVIASREYGLFEKKKLDLDDLREHISLGHVPIVRVNWDRLYIGGAGTKYHALVVTGVDDENVYYHESNKKYRESHKAAPRKIFERAWSAGSANRGTIIVYGKRS